MILLIIVGLLSAILGASIGVMVMALMQINHKGT